MYLCKYQALKTLIQRNRGVCAVGRHRLKQQHLILQSNASAADSQRIRQLQDPKDAIIATGDSRTLHGDAVIAGIVGTGPAAAHNSSGDGQPLPEDDHPDAVKVSPASSVASVAGKIAYMIRDEGRLPLVLATGHASVNQASGCSRGCRGFNC